MEPIWKSRSEGRISPLAESPPMPMPSLIWKLLKSRGYVSSEEVGGFLSPSLSKLASPFTLKDIDEAVDRLILARMSGETICIYGDYDLDGSTGVALLYYGLKGLGFENVQYYQPSRFTEGYGIHKDALKTIRERGAQVVVSVDCGITAIEEAAFAKELGLDLVITDHHLPRSQPEIILPDCVAVVNPNRGDCESQLQHLAGVGVGFYLLLAIKNRMGVTDFDPREVLDFFTIGTISDMVPLKGENRSLVKLGLKRLAETKRPGLQALVRRLSLENRSLDSYDIGFSLAPKLNALSRLEQGLRPLDIFLCEDYRQAEVLAEQVVNLNAQRKHLQSVLEEKVLAQLDKENPQAAAVFGAAGHPGVVGLVATKVAGITGLPTFVVAWQDQKGTGSARGLEHHILPQALSFASAHLERFGGHAQAAGFSMKADKFSDFRSSVIQYYSENETTAILGGETYDVDAELKDFSENFMDWLKHLGPFGVENPQPLFRLPQVYVTSAKWLKDQHLKVILNDRTARMEGIAFFARGKFDVQVGEKMEAIVEPSWNYWQGSRRIQLMIRALRPLHQ
ncbi:MAG: single-stranded-DNA-specific exonuclease RecJ [Oligoflexia bacterium]|nr:single-stranded-DNA-specific exonuclease RecJ [Oligoflexia bacterium]